MDPTSSCKCFTTGPLAARRISPTTRTPSTSISSSTIVGRNGRIRRGVWAHHIIPEYTPVVVSGLTFLPIHRTDDLYTGFFQDEISLLQHRLSLTIGTKVLHTNFATFKPEPSARLLWSLSERQSVWLAFTHAVRTPSDAEENFALSGYIGGTTAGRRCRILRDSIPIRAFAPERLNGSELPGYRLLLG